MLPSFSSCHRLHIHLQAILFDCCILYLLPPPSPSPACSLMLLFLPSVAAPSSLASLVTAVTLLLLVPSCPPSSPTLLSSLRRKTLCPRPSYVPSSDIVAFRRTTMSPSRRRHRCLPGVVFTVAIYSSLPSVAGHLVLVRSIWTSTAFLTAFDGLVVYVPEGGVWGAESGHGPAPTSVDVNVVDGWDVGRRRRRRKAGRGWRRRRGGQCGASSCSS